MTVEKREVEMQKFEILEISIEKLLTSLSTFFYNKDEGDKSFYQNLVRFYDE